MSDLRLWEGKLGPVQEGVPMQAVNLLIDSQIAEPGLLPTSPAYGPDSVAVPQPMPLRKHQTFAIILAMQRSGTSLLTVELSRHPCISMQSELFVQGSWNPKLQKQVVEVFFGTRVSDVQMLVLPNITQDILKKSRQAVEEGAAVQGFNWKLNQDFIPCWHTWLGDWAAHHGVRLIWVQRINLLRRIFSNHANKQTGVAVTTNKSQAKTVGSVQISMNTSNILKELAKDELNIKAVKAILADARRKGVQVQTVYYENMTESLDVVRRFLLQNSSCTSRGRAALKQRSGYSKIHAAKLKYLVRNWEQLRKTLRHTSWEWMLST